MKTEQSLDLNKITALKKTAIPDWTQVISKVLSCFFLFFTLLLAITPWQQTSQGTGLVIAYDPNDRLQNISSTVPGRIKKWFVRDGAKVKEGDPIVELVDNDPNFIDRLKLERDAILKNYEATKAASETALINYKRQKDLFEHGLSSRATYEKAKIEHKKLLANEATAAANLAIAEVKYSRQQSQLITAPRDGTILRVLHGSGSVYVKEGDVLAAFVPDTLVPAAEVYISGNDLPLVYPGRHVRLQFEGWPAIQFSGWPSVAVGTFGGVVSIVDPSASRNGKFRVIVIPEKDEKWPDTTYLRQGARVYAWILLNRVQLGYELWRQFNGFPPSLDSQPDSFDESKENQGKDKTKSKEQKNYKDIYQEK